MKNVSTILFAAVAILASSTLLNAQNTSSYSTQTNGQNSNQWNNPTNAKSYTQPSNISTQGHTNDDYNNPQDNRFVAATDDELAQKIRWAIRDDKILSPLAKTIDVTVKNYNVTLSGTVASQDEKERISAIARQLQGVKSVSNNLLISSK